MSHIFFLGVILRIAIIAHLKHAISEPFAGGLEMHTHLLAQGLKQRGHAVTTFATTRSNPALGLEAICDETSLLSAGIAEANDVAFFREHHAYLRLMTELRRRPFDVIHNNSLHYLPVSMAETLSIPMLTSLHTPPFCWLESGIRVARGNILYVAVSNATAAMWHHVAQVDRVVANGIALADFPYRATPDEDPYLMWHGRIVPEKGLHLAIEAARRAGLPLRIAGPISDRVYHADVIAPLLGPDAVYVGHLDHVALAALVGGACVALCTPCWEEPYGLVVAEALACGTPVAAFRRGGVADILAPDCGVLVEPDGVAALAEAVGYARTLDRAACRRRAESFCDAERMVDGYEALYREMVASPRIMPNADETSAVLSSVA